MIDRYTEMYIHIYISIMFVSYTYIHILNQLIIECDVCRISYGMTYFPVKSNTKIQSSKKAKIQTGFLSLDKTDTKQGSN